MLVTPRTNAKYWLGSDVILDFPLRTKCLCVLRGSCYRRRLHILFGLAVLSSLYVSFVFPSFSSISSRSWGSKVLTNPNINPFSWDLCRHCCPIDYSCPSRRRLSPEAPRITKSPYCEGLATWRQREPKSQQSQICQLRNLQHRQPHPIVQINDKGKANQAEAISIP